LQNRFHHGSTEYTEIVRFQKPSEPAVVANNPFLPRQLGLQNSV